MDSGEPSATRRKHRFAPKAPSQRKTRSTAVPKREKADDKEDDEAKKQLLQRFNELGTHRQRRRKAETNAPVQPTFIHGAKQSGSFGVLNVPQDGGLKQSVESDLMDLDDNAKQSVSTLSVVRPSVVKESSDGSVSKSKEYKEPWNYGHSYYPTTLPSRRPFSGNPDLLDEAEFGEAATKLEYNENAISPAAELGFLNPDETSENVRLLFLQLPRTLPAIKRLASAKGKEIAGTPGTPSHKGPTAMNKGAQRSCSLDDLSSGQMGKLLVYKSGAVKLKLGEVLYDVSSGENCSFAQEVVAFNTHQKECCSIGNLDKRAIVTPDINSLAEFDQHR